MVTSIIPNTESLNESLKAIEKEQKIISVTRPYSETFYLSTFRLKDFFENPIEAESLVSLKDLFQESYRVSLP